MSEDEKSYALKQMHDRNIYLQKENQRLNNVLNKIYDDLMFDYKDLDVKKLKLDGMDNSITDLTDSYWLGYIHACEEVFDRINELKESDK